MAYVIGNTTVISNNGALGSVDGNNLNLGNNSNIQAGGVSNATLYTSTTNVTHTSGAMYIAVGGGGGAGGQSPGGAGANGGMGVGGTSTGPITFTIGSAGSGGNGRGNRGNPTSVASPGLTANVRGGGSGGGVYFQPGQGPGPGVGDQSFNPGSVLMDSNTIYGGKGNAQPGNPPGNPGTAGAVKAIFF